MVLVFPEAGGELSEKGVGSWAGGERREAEMVTGGRRRVERSPRPPEDGENRAENGVRGHPLAFTSFCLSVLVMLSRTDVGSWLLSVLCDPHEL